MTRIALRLVIAGTFVLMLVLLVSDLEKLP